jgi:hypothetical protein
MGEVMDEDQVKFQLGELTAMVNNLAERIDKMERTVSELNSYKGHLISVGATVSFFLAAVGFLFGDGFRAMAKRLFNGG